MLPRIPHPLSAHPYHPPFSYESSAMPPAMDPTDYRAFYPYTPNEVKHRKRTTSAQLKVLEGIFRRDTKPNAALRQELAGQLNMTARGVQVWFQNRRAKEKTKATKGAPKSSAKDVDSPSPRSSEDADCESPTEATVPDLTSSSEPSPVGTSPPQLHVITDSADSSWQSSPIIETPEDQGFDMPFLLGARRGSLPVNVFPQDHTAYGPPPLDPHDPLARRRSVDASIRLPYNMARAKGNLFMTTQRLSHGRQHPLHRLQHTARPGMTHRSTMPIHTRHASMDSRGYRFSPAPSPSPSPLSPYVRAALPDHQHYARTVSAPIPGPLPSPGFQFGVANAGTSPDSERSSPIDFSGFSFPRDDADTDDGSASYSFSRFGSIASESSATSAYYSDTGSTGEPPEFAPNARRESCPTGFLNLMSGLDVSGPRRASLAEGLIGSGSYSHQANSDQNENQVAAGYPSPSSTVSPGSSPHHSANASAVPVSNSSELTYALHSKQQQQPYRSTDQDPPFFFDSNYPHSAPATSDSSLEFGDKYNFDYSLSYAPNAEGYPEAGFEGAGQQQGGIGQYQMDFTQPEPYYDPNPTVDTPFTYS
ncbi:hypothetical protein C8J57DRAFT_1284958 [Mycena rebaudengoi]|nr:hypothetical protein C8J57DRAFT_1284958 [Mycena rebaudengoi]